MADHDASKTGWHDDEPDLDAAIAALAAALVPRLIAELRDGAVADVRAELAGRLTAELLRRCEAELGLAAPRREAVGLYVYGVVRSGIAMPRDLLGVDPDAPVRLLETRGLAALVSEVPRATFDEAALRRNFGNVAWLEETARAHERVLDAALASTAVVPLRLGTVLVGAEPVLDLLRREHAALLDALERLTGRAEWGVKVFAAPGAIEREAFRRAARDDEEWDDTVPAGTEWAEEIHAELALLADEALMNPPQCPQSGGHPGEMLLNGVYLVDDEEASAFRSMSRELAERFAGRGLDIVLDGPGPAYNFVKCSIEAAR
jgi:gas vesicle protein GvpL/GvpF